MAVYTDMLWVIIVIICVCFLVKVQRGIFDDRLEILSALDGNKYLVRNTQFAKETADALARLKNKITTFVRVLDEQVTGEFRPVVQRIRERLKRTSIAEGVIDRRYTSYTVNKGDNLVMCMRSRDGKDMLYDDNMLFGVTLHELGHIASVSEGHEMEFKINFQFLLEMAEKLGFYTRIKSPFNYCGVHVTSL